MSLLSQQKFKYFRSLKNKKFRNIEGKFIIEGIKFCQEAINAKAKINTFLFHPQTFSSTVLDDFLKICSERKIPYYEISDNMLNILSDTVHSQGIISIIEKREHNINFHDLNFILAIDAAQDPGNVGTIIRTAAWFNIDAILLGTGSVDLYNSKVLRSTMGSIFHFPILENITLLNHLNKLHHQGFSIYCADVHGANDYHKIRYSKKKILVVGNENKGISAEIASISESSIKIPQLGKIESLNLAIATGILLSKMVNYDI